MFISQSAGVLQSTVQNSLMLSGLNLAASNVLDGNGGDISPISSTASFSSVDTNQTLLNAIINQQQTQTTIAQQQSLPATPICNNRNNNRSFRTKYSQFMIITPAVSIDREFHYETLTKTTTTTLATTTTTTTNTTTTNGNENCIKNEVLKEMTAKNCNETIEIDDMSSYFNNGNIFRMSLLQGSVDSGCSSDSSSIRSNYNPYLHTSRSHLLPKTTPSNFYTFSSWRWCTLICAAMRCFGGGHSNQTTYTRPPYQRTRSHGYTPKPTQTMHQRLRPSSSFTAETAYEHFSAPFTPRKTRDHLNNITYEL